MQSTFFEKDEKSIKDMPLAARMRPKDLSEVVGQEHVIGENKPLRVMIESGKLSSILLWGPPGSGKTTIAEVIANTINAHFERISAVEGGVSDVRKVIQKAKDYLAFDLSKTILFIDEIHRFNKAQQDALLPHIEDGTIILIGATTENPSFSVNNALISRSKVYVLQSLSEEDIGKLIKRAIKDKKRGLGNVNIKISNESIIKISKYSCGDARIALGILETCANLAPYREDESIKIDDELLSSIIEKKTLLYDKNGDYHYDLISALHKSMRGSDPDASLYWLVRMLESGEDPVYIARRLVRFASEDIGIADSQALNICISALLAVQNIGMPECNLALAQAVIYLACAPKSNSIYAAYNAALKDVNETINDNVPMHLRNAPTKLMKDLGYSDGYIYPPDVQKENPENMKLQDYLPEKLKTHSYYLPSYFGREKIIKEWLDKRRAKK